MWMPAPFMVLPQDPSMPCLLLLSPLSLFRLVRRLHLRWRWQSRRQTGLMESGTVFLKVLSPAFIRLGMFSPHVS